MPEKINIPGFTLHPTLANDTFPVCDLSLCTVLLMNNQRFPWLILVPKQPDLREITDLPADLQHTLMDEITHASRTLQHHTKADKMNIAALGNMVPQLHIHIIARFSGDKAWPSPVWGTEGKAYNPDAAEARITALRTALQ